MKILIGTFLLLSAYASASYPCETGHPFLRVDADEVASVEPILLRKLPSVIRKGDSLVVRTPVKDVVLVDEKRGQQSVSYYLLGHYGVSASRTDYLVVQVLKGRRYVLINGQDGTSIWVGGEPVISPDCERYAVSSCDFVGQFGQNSMAVVKAADFAVECRFTYDGSEEFSEPASYEPTCTTDALWLDETRVIFLLTTLEDPRAYRFTRIPCLLEFEDGKWRRLPLSK
jgi:hypothetical protein